MFIFKQFEKKKIPLTLISTSRVLWNLFSVYQPLKVPYFCGTITLGLIVSLTLCNYQLCMINLLHNCKKNLCRCLETPLHDFWWLCNAGWLLLRSFSAPLWKQKYANKLYPVVQRFPPWVLKNLPKNKLNERFGHRQNPIAHGEAYSASWLCLFLLSNDVALKFF